MSVLIRMRILLWNTSYALYFLKNNYKYAKDFDYKQQNVYIGSKFFVLSSK